MSTLFISYSTKDRPIAETFYEKLIEMGYEKPFRDDHPDSGIPVGSDWERELYRKLRLCKALIVLCSKNWLDSKWCFAELAYAKAMGKEFFPVLIDDSPDLPKELAERQTIKFSDVDIWYRLRRGLVEADLAPQNDFVWPVEDYDECPYPGLSAFEAHHAGVYFGRDDEILALRERLNQMASRGKPRLLYVVGASGSGKSSLVKAGLLPRLTKKEASRWCVLRTFRWNELQATGRDWLEQLSINLLFAWRSDDAAKPNWKTLRERYSQSPAAAADHFIDDTKDLLIARHQPNAVPLLVIDQFEELLSAVDDNTVKPFLAFLGCVLSSPRSPYRCITTVRTDFLAAIQTRAELIAWKDHADVYSLPLMKPDRFYDVIRRPAEKLGITFESDALVDQIVKDTGTNDALPLLSFALRELYEQFGDDKRFTLEEYSKRLGGLEGCLSRVANELFSERVSSYSAANAENQRRLLIAFSNHLVRIDDHDEKDEFVRSAAVWSEFEPDVQALLQRFIDRRLITSRPRDDTDPSSERVVEVAHEALFRKWDKLARWLDDRRDLLRWRRDVERDRFNDGDKWAGLSDRQLANARDWLERRREELLPREIAWINSAKQRAARSRIFLISAVILFAVVAALAIVFWIISESRLKDLSTKQLELEQANTELEKTSAKATRTAAIADARRLATESLSMREQYPQRSALLALEALHIGLQQNVRVADAETTLRSALASLNGQGFSGHKRKISIASMSRDNRWFATGSWDSTTRLYDFESRDWQSSASTLEGNQSRVTTLAFSPDNRWLATAGPFDNVRVWSLPYEPTKAPIILSHENDTEIRRNGAVAVRFSEDSRKLVSVHEDNSIRIWQVTTDSVQQPAELKLAGDSEMRSIVPNRPVLAMTSDFQRLIGGTDARLRKFGTENVETIVLQEEIIAGAEITPDGRWALTIDDNQLKIWDLTQGGVAELSHIVPHENRIFGIDMSPDGRWFATYTRDGPMRLWEIVGNRAPEAPVFVSDESVIGGAVGNHLFATVQSDGRIQLRDPKDLKGVTREILRNNDASLSFIGFSYDGEYLYTGSDDGTSRLFRVQKDTTLSLPVSVSSEGRETTAVAVSDNKKWLVTFERITNDPTKTFTVWDISEETPTVKESGYLETAEDIFASAVSSDSHWIAATSGHRFMGGKSTAIHLWYLSKEADRQQFVLADHEQPVVAMAFSPDSLSLVSGDKDGVVRIWDLSRSGERPIGKVWGRHDDSVQSVVFSADNRWVATGSSDGSALLCDLGKQDPKVACTALKPTTDSTRDGSRLAVWVIAFDPENKYLATGGQGGIAWLWPLEVKNIGSKQIEFRGQGADVTALAFSSDGKWFATANGHPHYSDGEGKFGTKDGTVNLWNLEVKQPNDKPIELKGHERGVRSVTFLDQDRLLASSANDGTVHLWPLKTLDEQKTPIRFSVGSAVFDLAVGARDKWLITRSADNSLKMWRLRLTGLEELAKRKIGRNLTPYEWQLHFPGKPFKKRFQDLP